VVAAGQEVIDLLSDDEMTTDAVQSNFRRYQQLSENFSTNNDGAAGGHDVIELLDSSSSDED
jgi:hypothetical protein